MRQYIEQFILDNYSQFAIEQPAKLSIIFLTSGHSKKINEGKIVGLIFKDDESMPFLVAKFYRDESKSLVLEQEYNAVKKMVNNGITVLSQPYCLEIVNNKLIYFEKYCLGKSLNAQLHNFVNQNKELDSNYIDFFNLHFNKVKQIHTQLNNECVTDNFDNLSQEITQLKKEYFKIFNPSDFDKKIIDSRLQEFLYNNEKKEIFKRVINLDFNHFNIITRDFRNNIIDWEYSRESRMLFLEPLRFCFFYVKELFLLKYFDNNSDDFLAVWANIWKSENPLGDLIKNFIKEACHIKTIREVELLFIIFFMQKALLQFEVSRSIDEGFKAYESNHVLFACCFFDYDLFQKSQSISIVREQKKIIVNQEKIINDLYNSNAWKITKPLRLLMDKYFKK